MKFLVTSRKKAGVDAGDERETLQLLLDNFDYYDELANDGVVVDRGVFPGEHASYSVFRVDDEEEVWRLLESAPLNGRLYHDVNPVLDPSKAREKVRFYLDELM